MAFFLLEKPLFMGRRHGKITAVPELCNLEAVNEKRRFAPFVITSRFYAGGRTAAKEIGLVVSGGA
jgi:hypothetical protein